MPAPMHASDLQARLHELFDDSVEKNEIWLAYTRRALDAGHATGVLTDAEYNEALGVTLGQMGEFETAIGHGREAVRLTDGGPRQRHNLAVTLWRADLLDEAAEQFELVASTNDELAVPSWCLLAGVRVEQGKWKSARRAYRTAWSAADQDRPYHLRHLAMAASNVGLPSDALRLTARMLAIRQGGGPRIGWAAADPAAFVESAAREDLDQVPSLVIQSLWRYLLRRAPVEPAIADDGTDTSEAEAVFEAWRDSRARANAAVMGEDDGSA